VSRPPKSSVEISPINATSSSGRPAEFSESIDTVREFLSQIPYEGVPQAHALFTGSCFGARAARKEENSPGLAAAYAVQPTVSMP
jgi:dienelactone hydrolase